MIKILKRSETLMSKGGTLQLGSGSYSKVWLCPTQFTTVQYVCELFLFYYSKYDVLFEVRMMRVT